MDLTPKRAEIENLVRQAVYRRLGTGTSTAGPSPLRVNVSARHCHLTQQAVGALFGLYDWRFEVLGLVTHARALQRRYHCGPHTISFPRLRPASGVCLETGYTVSDADFMRMVAILRLAVPYTGLILTASEPAALRRELMAFGVSQIDGGSRIEIGGYTEGGPRQEQNREQFGLTEYHRL